MAELLKSVLSKVYSQDTDQLAGTELQKFNDFDQLVRRYQKQAYNIAYRMTGNHADAEDLTQEAFVRAYRFFGNYKRDWPFDNWLYKIMSNLFVDSLRRKPKAKVQSLDQPLEMGDRSDDVFFEIPDLGSNPERMVLSRELDEHIQRALNTLPPDFRMTVILADIEGLSYEEISEHMKCSLGTVRSRLHRGRKLLRARITAFQKTAEVDEARREQAYAQATSRDAKTFGQTFARRIGDL